MKSFQVAGDGRVFGIFPSESKARSYKAELSGKGIRTRIRVVQDESTKGRAKAGELDISSKRSLDATLDWIRDEVGGGCNLTAFAKSDRGCYRLRYEMRPAAKGIRWKTELSRDGSVLGRASVRSRGCAANRWPRCLSTGTSASAPRRLRTTAAWNPNRCSTTGRPTRRTAGYTGAPSRTGGRARG